MSRFAWIFPSALVALSIVPTEASAQNVDVAAAACFECSWKFAEGFDPAKHCKDEAIFTELFNCGGSCLDAQNKPATLIIGALLQDCIKIRDGAEKEADVLQLLEPSPLIGNTLQ